MDEGGGGESMKCVGKECVQLVCAVFLSGLLLFSSWFFSLVSREGSLAGMVDFGLGLGWCWGYYWLKDSLEIPLLLLFLFFFFFLVSSFLPC